MKHLFSLILLALVAVVMSGCASVEIAGGSDLNGRALIATPGRSVAHINAQNWGLYVLSFPIATGSIEAVGKTAWFSENSVNVTSMVKVITAKAKGMNASKVTDMSSTSNSAWIFPVFFMKSVNVSGNAIQ